MPGPLGSSLPRGQQAPRNRHLVHRLSRSRRPGRSTGAQGEASDTTTAPPSGCHTPEKVSEVPTTARRPPQAGERPPDDGLLGHWRLTSRQPANDPPADAATSHERPNKPASQRTTCQWSNNPPAPTPRIGTTTHRGRNPPLASTWRTERQGIVAAHTTPTRLTLLRGIRVAASFPGRDGMGQESEPVPIPKGREALLTHPSTTSRCVPCGAPVGRENGGGCPLTSCVLGAGRPSTSLPLGSCCEGPGSDALSSRVRLCVSPVSVPAGSRLFDLWRWKAV